MKKWILGAAVLTCLSLGLSAQQHRRASRPLTPAEQAERRVERMAEVLSLTEKQEKQVSQLALEGANRQEELQKKRKAEVERQKEFRLAQEEKLATILTDEQKQIWEQRKEAFRDRDDHQSRDGHRRGGKPRFSRGR